MGRSGYHLISSMGGEVPPNYLLMSPSTGTFGVASDMPVYRLTASASLSVLRIG